MELSADFRLVIRGQVSLGDELRCVMRVRASVAVLAVACLLDVAAHLGLLHPGILLGNLVAVVATPLVLPFLLLVAAFRIMVMLVDRNN